MSLGKHLSSSFSGIFLALLLFGVLLSASTARADERSMKCLNAVLQDGYGRVPLFSAIPLRDSALAKTWARLAPKARQDFPGLRTERPEDLHITLVFLGSGWNPEKIEQIAQNSLIGPAHGSLHSPLHPEVFGKNGQVMALRLESVPEEWSERINSAKQRLNEQGLKKPDLFNLQFKPHISLAQFRAADTSPEVMKRFQKWIEDAAIWNQEFQSLELTPKNAPELLLSYRPTPTSPLYTPLEALCPHWQSTAIGACRDAFGRLSH